MKNKKIFAKMIFANKLLKTDKERGVNGMYIYACDPELQAALLKAAK